MLLTPNEAADVLAISRRTLERWRSMGVGPAFVRVSGNTHYSCIRYKLEDLKRYIHERTEQPGDTGGKDI